MNAAMDKVADAIVSAIHAGLPDEDKPVIEVLMNRKNIVELSEKVQDYVQDGMVNNPGMSVARERSARVNAVFTHIIETLERFIEENV